MKNNLNDLLSTMKMHEEADRISQGSWLNEEKDEDGYFKGCFFGCAMQTEHEAIEKACEKYGLPLWIGYWSEKVFEGLPQKMALTWPVELLESLIAYSGDMESLMHKLAVKRLSFLAEYCEGEVKSVINSVIECHLDPENSDWSAARSAADSAWAKERCWMIDLLRQDKGQ